MNTPTPSIGLYDVLGIPATATPAEVKRAFRAAAKRCHPDTGGSAEEFARVQLAWHVLGDPERRARYDATGDQSEPEPDNSLAMIHTLIMGALDRVMQSGRIGDLVGDAARMLDSDAAQGKQANHILRGNRDKLENVRRRLKFKGDGVDLIDRTLAERIGEIERSIAANTEVMERVVEAAERLRGGWTYEVEVQQAPVWGMPMTWVSSGT